MQLFQPPFTDAAIPLPTFTVVVSFQSCRIAVHRQPSFQSNLQFEFVSPTD